MTVIFFVFIGFHTFPDYKIADFWTDVKMKSLPPGGRRIFPCHHFGMEKDG
jgi:hypothetical protein